LPAWLPTQRTNVDVGPSKHAIVGGTGTFAGARGWMDLRARNKKGTEYDFVSHLS
jgi:hypothetical protein